MHRHLAGSRTSQGDAAPAKVIVLESRRKARLETAWHERHRPRPAA